MGLATAFNTSLNGMSLNEDTIDVLSNNVANSGTNGFKGSEVLFATELARTLSVGSRPTATNGGTNPRQTGLGANTTAIRKDFTQGSITSSSSASDLAIQGEGFFITEGNGTVSYTRNGNFSLNSEDSLVNTQGLRVQGYGVDDQFNLVTTELTTLEIPVGTQTVAQQTSEVLLRGALRSSGTVATQGTIMQSGAMTDVGTGLAITTASQLADVRDGTGAALFTVGETLEFTPREGARSSAPSSLAVTAATTVADLNTLFDQAYGLHSGGAIPNDSSGSQPGVTVTAGGQIQILGNMGTVNELDFAAGDLTSNGSSINIPFTKSQEATGESAVADLVVFDSLGEPIPVTVSTVLESTTNGGSIFRYFVDSQADSDADSVIANGTIEFDSNGFFVPAATSPTISIDRADSPASSPMTVTLDFSRISGVSSETNGSLLAIQDQNGSGPGTLSSFVIDEGGIVNGIFDNGVTRTLGQVVLARFANNQGLVETGGTGYSSGIGAGSPLLTTPGNFGAGTIRSGAIELSNVDLGENLVDLILASTNYRGNARVLSSVQELTDELLLLGR